MTDVSGVWEKIKRKRTPQIVRLCRELAEKDAEIQKLKDSLYAEVKGSQKSFDLYMEASDKLEKIQAAIVPAWDYFCVHPEAMSNAYFQDLIEILKKAGKT